MRVISLETTLRPLAQEAVAAFGRLLPEESGNTLNFTDYHGFEKAQLPKPNLDDLLRPHGLTHEDIQIELVRVGTDLRSQLHFHEKTFACCVIMGRKNNAPEPRYAMAYVGKGWFPVHVGEVIAIPPRVIHGFTVGSNGILCFVSVQAPPIKGRDGVDDYRR